MAKATKNKKNKKRQEEKQAVNYRNVELYKPDPTLVNSYKQLQVATRKRIKKLTKIYRNQGVPYAKVNTLVNQKLAEIYGVSKIITQTGYVNKHPFPVKLVEIKDDRGLTHYINLMAYPSYAAMIAEAHKLDIVIEINESFRTMERQTELYNRYKDSLKPGYEGRKYGIAAEPGKSRHQMGYAIDVGRTGTNTGRISRLWLSKFGPKYGWYRTVKSEPWHFTFLYDKITSIDESEQYVLDIIQQTQAIIAGSASFSEEAFATLIRDKVDAHTRANLVAFFTRGEALDSSAEQLAYEALDKGDKTLLEEYLSHAMETAVQFSSTPLPDDSPYLFSFDTGLWGDNKQGGTVVSASDIVSTPQTNQTKA